MTTMDAGAALEHVRQYYRCLDADRYGELRELLAPDFTQVRSDRRFEDRAAFIQFMRADRPVTGTTHELEALFRPVGRGDSPRVAAQGTLCHPDGQRMFGFVDVHRFDGEQIDQLRTYTD